MSQSITCTHVAFGDNDTAESLADEHLGNEMYRDAIDDHVDNSDNKGYTGTLLIGSDEAVSLNLKGAALVNESDTGKVGDIAANRALLDDPDDHLNPKDSGHAVTVRIELSYVDESEVTIPVDGGEMLKVYRWDGFDLSDGLAPSELDVELLDGDDTVRGSIFKLRAINTTDCVIDNPGVSAHLGYMVV